MTKLSNSVIGIENTKNHNFVTPYNIQFYQNIFLTVNSTSSLQTESLRFVSGNMLDYIMYNPLSACFSYIKNKVANLLSEKSHLIKSET